MKVELKRISTATETGVYDLEAEAVILGEDILVYIWGGDAPHIGAVALAQPRPSLADASRVSATASVLTRLGHKEDQAVRHAAIFLSSALNRNVLVSAGMHWNAITSDGIETVLANLDILLHQLSRKLAGEEV